MNIDAWLRANVPPEEWPPPQYYEWLKRHPGALKGMYSRAQLKEFRPYIEQAKLNKSKAIAPLADQRGAK